MKIQKQKWHKDYNFIYDIEPLIFNYPHGVFTGSFSEGITTYQLSFEDVCTFLGHVCLCGAGGYKIVQHAINQLSDSEVLERDQFMLQSSHDHTISDVAAFILGCPRRNDPKKNRYSIKPESTLERRVYRYKIGYEPSHKAVEILYHKHLIIGNDKMDELWKIEKALDTQPESVSENNKITYRNAMIKMVRNVLFDKVQGLFEIKEIAYNTLK
ncbi:MAG TPA: hypothetical protein ENG70_00535 [Candidatus Cloacimonetes bacterium]|nr:hypothetical protein [Candidatus Cloacimonadota bacterium]HEX37341.1 hypothetical protein [Candidatus Cloacimonadota bacterium]